MIARNIAIIAVTLVAILAISLLVANEIIKANTGFLDLPSNGNGENGGLLPACPYECCNAVSGYAKVSCPAGFLCVNYECVEEEEEQPPPTTEPCPYECCENDTNYEDKLCTEPLTCENYSCVLPECPYECCAGDANYADKGCSEGFVCENNECTEEEVEGNGTYLSRCPYVCCSGESNYYDKRCRHGGFCINRVCVLPTCPYECCMGETYQQKNCTEGFECIDYECAEETNEMSEEEQLGKDFFDSKMIDLEGGVYCTYRTGWPPELHACANHKFGSERTGLAMLYYAYAPDSEQLNKQINFLENYMLSPYKLLYWKLDEDYNHEDYTASASIDDIRVVQALLIAYEKYGNNDYYNLAMQIADAIKQYEVVDSNLTQGASWDDQEVYTNQDLYLSYANLRAMGLIAQYDSDWQAIKQNTAQIIVSGSYGNGLFHEIYDYNSGQYSNDTELNSIHQATIGLNLAAYDNALAQQNLDFWKAEWHDDNHIASSYTTSGEDACTWCDDISVYALVARFAHELGDTEFETEMIDAIKATQISDSASEFYGAFTWDEAYPISSYVNALALVALATQRSS